jgi:hypothetical protein
MEVDCQILLPFFNQKSVGYTEVELKVRKVRWWMVHTCRKFVYCDETLRDRKSLFESGPGHSIAHQYLFELDIPSSYAVPQSVQKDTGVQYYGPGLIRTGCFCLL